MPMPSRRFVFGAIALLLIPTAALGCLWDYDTIKMERTRFPGTLELITGKFLRHSPEFYRWRIENRLKRLESDPGNVALLDDLAVAYDKTGQHEKAIETALRTEKLHPGRYETSSNLSTFYFHAGKFQEVRAPIDRALAINPNAHFGREKYQKLLLEYVIKQCPDGKLKFPLANVELYLDTAFESPTARELKTHTSSFADTFWTKDDSGPLKRDVVEPAVKALLGMMKFAKHDSPVLLEALGSMLAQQGWNIEEDAKRLSARAYLKASYEVPDGQERTSYRALAARALRLQAGIHKGEPTPLPLELLETDFKKELSEGKVWYEELREKELSWIRDGKDPETEFDKLYDIEPEVSGMDVRDPMTPPEKFRLFVIIARSLCTFASVATLAILGLLVRRYLRRRVRRAVPVPDLPK